MITAEQVRECVGTVYLEGYSDGSVNRGAHIDETDWQAIADKLNAALGCEECKMAFGEDMLPECGNCGEPLIYHTKRHGMRDRDRRSAKFCPKCGKAVKRWVC